MLLFILLPLLAFLFFAIRFKRRNKSTEWTDVGKRYNHFINNDGWILWLVVFFVLGVIEFCFAYSFSNLNYGLSRSFDGLFNLIGGLLIGVLYLVEADAAGFCRCG